MPDYTKQLQEIAAALSRPPTSAWLVAVVSSVVGFTSAVLLQFVQHGVAERVSRKRTRRVLYIDLAEMFFAVESIRGVREMNEPQRWQWQKEQLKLHVGFKGEKHLRANEETYMQLDERPVAESVYAYFHRALDDVDNWFNVNWSIARQVFAQAVAEDWLRRKQFGRFIGKEQAARLHSQCSAIHEESQCRLKAFEQAEGPTTPKPPGSPSDLPGGSA